MTEKKTFKELGLSDEIINAISYMGYDTPTPIQEQSIPHILQGKDIIACAQTGTGKTAAFLLPILNKLAENPKDGALVVVPTRELAIQIDQQIQGLGYFLGVSSLAIYGGGDAQDWDVQKKSLIEGINIIVATPGKFISHINMGYVNFKNIKYLVLDEADRMLDMGFREDISKIISFVKQPRQVLLFSATMPSKIRELAQKNQNDPVQINLALAKPAEGVLQGAYLVREEEKARLIADLIADKPTYKSIIIFSSTRKNIGTIIRELKRKGIDASPISSDLEQKERERILLQFKSRQVRVLVATDVISRGIDVKDIQLVINYDVPSNAEDYVHRIGRTARAETTGVALTLINQRDIPGFKEIESLIDASIFKIPLPVGYQQGPDYNKPVEKKSFKPGRKPFKRRKPQ